MTSTIWSADKDSEYRSAWVDVRDLATAHVLAITTPEAGGERIIISHEKFKLQDFGEHHCPSAQIQVAEVVW